MDITNKIREENRVGNYVYEHFEDKNVRKLLSTVRVEVKYPDFEEYFALEKSSTERREPLGTTDIDKIESHGFDKKTSFRGK